MASLEPNRIQSPAGEPAAGRRAWATPRVIVSVDASSAEAKHITHNPDTHPPSSATAVYS
jgi:hypothetical protein